jgi:aldose 1-epimerase
MGAMEIFGTLADGRAVERHRLECAAGVSVDILTLGGVIQRVFAPDGDGRLADIALGFADLEAYLADPYRGAIIGRCANRIANGRIEIDGVTYLLSRNSRRETLHGGDRGFHRALWVVEAAAADRLHLSHESPDGDQGFPGALRVDATYSLGPDGALRLDFAAATNKPTIVNLTSHAYWNLAGAGSGDVLDHRLQVEADAFTPVNERLLPTGEIRPVAGTPFDFREPRPLRDAVTASDPQIALAGGVDHNFVLRGVSGRLARAAQLSDPRSGRTLEVFTTEPGLQVYTGNSLADAKWGGVALETQHFPDSVHQPAFPSILLRPGDVFRSSTVFRLGLSPP